MEEPLPFSIVPVRLPAEWMNQTDERLLEYLDESGPTPPHVIELDERISYSRPYMNARLIKLRKAGLLVELGNGVYRIEPIGRAFLAGEQDLRDLPNPDK